jgi:hypothetical protein
MRKFWHGWYAALMFIGIGWLGLMTADAQVRSQPAGPVQTSTLGQVITPDGPSDLAAAKARIALLEVQLAQVQRQALIAQAQYTMCNEPQAAKAAKARLDAAGAEMGCAAGVDWNADPPKCLPGPK